jgi:phage shock protein A
MGQYDATNSSDYALGKLHTATAHAIAAQLIAQRDYDQAQAEADNWERQYQLALKEGHQDLARQAQFNKERHEAIANRLRSLVKQQATQVDTLKHNLTSWESKVSQAENKVLPRKFNPSSTTSAFEHVENKLLDTEAPAEAISQPDYNQGLELITVSFEDIDEELKRLKEQMFPPLTLEDGSPAIKDCTAILETAILETEKAVDSTFTSKEQIQKNYDQAKEAAQDWNKKAQIALQNNDDNLALQAIVDKTVQSKIAVVLKTQIQQQETVLTLLRQNLIALENVQKMLSDSAIPQNSELPVGQQTTASGSSAVVDAELETLRQQLDQM